MTWLDLAVQLTALQRLHLGGDRDGGNVLHGHRHVPGGVLRGALARRWILDHGVEPQRAAPAQQQHFRSVIERGLLPGPLWLDDTRLQGISERVCKRPITPECKDAGDDEAVALLQPGADPERGDTRPTCDGCGGPLEFGKGSVVGSGRALGTHQRNAIDPYHLVPEPGDDPEVFTVETLPAGSRFTGRLAVWHDGEPDAWVASLQEEVRTVFVGGDLGVYGRCELTLRPVEAPEVPLHADRRLAVRLEAPAVLTDVFGAPRLRFDGSDFAVGTADGAPVVPTVLRAWRRTADVTGWHLPSGMAKPVDQALAAGSTVLLEYPGSLDVDQLGELRQLRAIGHRTAEGYGAIRFLGASTSQAQEVQR